MKPIMRVVELVAASMVMCLLSIAAVEVGVRVFHLPVYGSHYPFITRGSYIRKHIPNEPYVYTKEGYSKGTFNSSGFLDTEHPLAKPEGVFRIAVLGDSMTEAIQVNREDNFCTLLERKLNRTGPRVVEVMNFAIQGYAMTDEYVLLQQEVMRYEPDLVLVAAFLHNDLEGHEPNLDPAKRRIFFRIGETGHLVRDDRYLEAYLHTMEGKLRLALDGRSKVFRMLSAAVRDLVVYREQPAPRSETSLLQHILSPSFYDAVPPDYAAAWHMTEALLSEMRDYTAARGSDFLVVSIPFGGQLLPRAEWERVTPRSTYDKPEQMLSEICERQAISCVHLLPHLIAQYSRTQQLPYFVLPPDRFAHLNEVGHAWVSEALHDALLRRWQEASRQSPTSSQ